MGLSKPKDRVEVAPDYFGELVPKLVCNHRKKVTLEERPHRPEIARHLMETRASGREKKQRFCPLVRRNGAHRFFDYLLKPTVGKGHERTHSPIGVLQHETTGDDLSFFNRSRPYPHRAHGCTRVRDLNTLPGGVVAGQTKPPVSLCNVESGWPACLDAVAKARMSSESPRPTPSSAPRASITPSHSDEGSRDDLLGRTVNDRYRIEARLGEGGMGTVYVAEHLALRKEVAFKVVHSDFADDSEVSTRFAREATASARLDHPHVATVIDYGTMPSGAAFMVMQLVRGRSLREELDARGALEWRSAAEVAAQIADAMVAAHEAGIVHRDLKPDNVLVELRADGTFLAKVLDFGVARIRLEGTEPEGTAPEVALTRLGTVVGTPGYMAPEQAMGEPVDERADLYALGVILWEMLSGKRLFPESDLAAIVTRQLTAGSPPLEIPADRPAPNLGVEALLREILQPQPARRPRQAREVRDRLRALAYGLTPEFAGRAPETPSRRSLPREWGSGVAGAVFGASMTLLAVALYLHAQPASPVAKPTVASAATQSAADEPDEATPSMIHQLLENENRNARRRAAEWIQSQPEALIPKFVREASRLEASRRCADQRDAIEALVEIGEPSTRRSIERFARAPRRGCGFLGLGDCYRCIRPIAASALERFGEGESN